MQSALEANAPLAATPQNSVLGCKAISGSKPDLIYQAATAAIAGLMLLLTTATL